MANNRTLSGFLTYIKYDFKRDDKDTEITQAYNDTLKHLCNLAPFENKKFQSWVPTVVGQEDYPLPAEKCHVIHPVRIIKSASDSSGYPLNKMTKQEFSERYPNPNASPNTSISKAQPVDYCIYSNSILVGPLPDLSTYMLELDWSKYATLQVADVDTNAFGEEWDEVIKWGCLARLYEGIGLTGEADRYWTLYRDDEYGYPPLIRKEQDQEQTMLKAENRSL